MTGWLQKIKGEELDFYRIRLGNYRVISSIEDGILFVFIVQVGHRGDIYKKL